MGCKGFICTGYLCDYMLLPYNANDLENVLCFNVNIRSLKIQIYIVLNRNS